MAGKTVTSATAIMMLRVDSVQETEVQIREFSVDDAFMTDAVPATEAQVGVDGYGVAGWVPRAPEMTIRLLASSSSFVLFEDWLSTMDSIQDALYASGSISIPSIKRKYTLYHGTLLRAQNLADARRVLQPREFHIMWLPSGQIPAISMEPTV